jgi:RNA polymerase sigma factor (TIGR02999 family)
MRAGQGLTELLRELAEGDRSALDRLVPLVYAELHRMAASYLKRENPDHTLQATALVHEAYLKLAGASQPDCQSRAHFYGIASRIMRQILVDHARARLAGRRGGGGQKVPIEDGMASFHERPRQMVALDDALEELGRRDPDKLHLVELRFFAGLSAEESAELLGLPLERVRYQLRMAQAWLRREMAAGQK